MDKTRLLRIVIIAGVIIVGVLMIYQIFLKPKTSSNANGTTGQTGSTDANGNPLVEYIPTSETVGNTLNYNYAAQGDAQQIIPLGTPPGGSQTVVVGGPGSSGQVGPTSGGGNVTTPPPVIVPPIIVPPQPPVTPPATPPPSNPPTSGGGASGTPPPAPPRFTNYTIVHGDTLSSIAARYHTTASAIYAANKATIDSWAQAHGYPVKHNPAWGNYPAAMDNIFPGEPLHIPLS